MQYLAVRRMGSRFLGSRGSVLQFWLLPSFGFALLRSFDDHSGDRELKDQINEILGIG